jgi:hypothetical protein
MRTMGVEAPLADVQQALAAALVHHLSPDEETGTERSNQLSPIGARAT